MKIKHKYIHTALLAGLLFFQIGASHAATIISTNATWPTTTAAETDDVFTSDPTPAGRAVSGTRTIRQTFQVASTFTIGSITLSAADYGNTSFTIKFFEVADIEAATWSAGTQVGSTITVAAFGFTDIGDKNLLISLSALEQFALAQRNAGVLGYGMELALVNTGGVAAFTWRHNGGVGDQAPGRHYRETGAGQALDADMGLALVAVPEPSAALLGGLGLLALLRRRR